MRDYRAINTKRRMLAHFVGNAIGWFLIGLEMIKLPIKWILQLKILLCYRLYLFQFQRALYDL